MKRFSLVGVGFSLALAWTCAAWGQAESTDSAWVQSLFKGFSKSPANRLHLSSSTSISGLPQPAVKAMAEYTYIDPRGKEVSAKAKLYLPAGVQQENKKIPLFYAAGYECDDHSATEYLKQGFAVVTPGGIDAGRLGSSNPLVRTANPDIALLHIARSLPFVDDARVIIVGGSAGGYMTLLLAAETFPLAGAAPAVPPINWSFNGAYLLQPKRHAQGMPDDPKGPKIPFVQAVLPVAEQTLDVYGPNTDDATWVCNSPLAQLPTITCPISVYWSTADVLVPMNQLSMRLVQPYDAKAFPKWFTMSPEKLCKGPEGRVRLMDVLNEKDFEMFVVPETTVRQSLKPSKNGKHPPELPFSRSKQWSIVILDEGCPGLYVGHTKYPVSWSQWDFYHHVATGGIPAGQLTLTKLERLMDRYSGKEWLPTAIKHLDFSASEQADVLRGLRTYAANSPENAKTLADLYAKLPAARQVLDKGILEELLRKP